MKSLGSVGGIFALGLCLFPAIVTAQSNYEPYRVITFAGGPTSGSADGIATAAAFSAPASVARDASGNIYVADSENHTIRKITPSGSVTTLAGLANNPGSVDGNGAEARFRRPLGVAVDAGGMVYVADTDNSIIRRISPAGDVTTLAGTAQLEGSADGNGSAARFSFPTSVAVSDTQVVYVSDYGNHTIRKIETDQTVSTFAGSAGQIGSDDGNGSAARFSHPWGVALDGAGNLFVADYFNSTIRKVTSAVDVSTIAGSPGLTGSDDGQGDEARFRFPTGIAVDSTGNVFVCDSPNHVLRKVTPTGLVTTLAGLPQNPGLSDGVGETVRFNVPSGVASDDSGHLTVADYSNNSIRTGELASQFSFALRITSIAHSNDGAVTLNGIGLPDTGVNVERSSDLISSFTEIDSTQTDAAGAFRYPSQESSGLSKSFYRVRQ